MADRNVTCKLAAILSVDMVGYSRLMEKDEQGTIALHGRQDLVEAQGVDGRGTMPLGANVEGYSRHMGRYDAELGGQPMPRRTDVEASAAHCRDPAVGGWNRESLQEPVHGLFDRLTVSPSQARHVAGRSHRFGRPILGRLGVADAT
jgi:hypothetical protein